MRSDSSKMVSAVALYVAVANQESIGRKRGDAAAKEVKAPVGTVRPGPIGATAIAVIIIAALAGDLGHGSVTFRVLSAVADAACRDVSIAAMTTPSDSSQTTARAVMIRVIG